MGELVPSQPDELEPRQAAEVPTPIAADAAPARTPSPQKLASEKIIINAPMSFAGAAQRSFRLRGSSTGLVRVGLTVAVVLLTLVWWALVLVWYVVFGLLLVPYRLLRRGARKRKAEALRHREMLGAIEQKNKD